MSANVQCHHCGAIKRRERGEKNCSFYGVFYVACTMYCLVQYKCKEFLPEKQNIRQNNFVTRHQHGKALQR